MEIRIVLTAEVERVSGPFASRDDIETAILEAIEGADPGTVEPGDNSYEVTSWEATAEPVGKSKPGGDVNARIVHSIRAHAQQIQALRGMITAAGLNDTEIGSIAQRIENSHDGLVAGLAGAKLVRMP